MKRDTIPYRGYNINVYYDEDADSPRDWDNLGTIYTAHRRYQPEKDFDSNFDINEVFDHKLGKFKESFLKDYVALNIYLYDHSGQAVSTTPFGDPWDSGWFGIIAVSVEEVKKQQNWKLLTKERREQVESWLQGEIDVLNQYYHGDVYWYNISIDEDELDEDETLEEIIDSCGGFYGQEGIEELVSEAKAEIDYSLEKQAKKRAEEAACENWWNGLM